MSQLEPQWKDEHTDSRGVTWARETPGRPWLIICRICREREAVHFMELRSVWIKYRGWVSEYHMCQRCAIQDFKQPVHAC